MMTATPTPRCTAAQVPCHQFGQLDLLGLNLHDSRPAISRSKQRVVRNKMLPDGTGVAGHMPRAGAASACQALAQYICFALRQGPVHIPESRTRQDVCGIYLHDCSNCSRPSIQDRRSLHALGTARTSSPTATRNREEFSIQKHHSSGSLFRTGSSERIARAYWGLDC